jgi:phage regulator Rha-like protein
MTDRTALVEKYKQMQKDLAAQQEKTKTQVLKKETAKIEFSKTEKYLKNLECIA